MHVRIVFPLPCAQVYDLGALFFNVPPQRQSSVSHQNRRRMFAIVFPLPCAQVYDLGALFLMFRLNGGAAFPTKTAGACSQSCFPCQRSFVITSGLIFFDAQRQSSVSHQNRRRMFAIVLSLPGAKFQPNMQNVLFLPNKLYKRPSASVRGQRLPSVGQKLCGQGAFVKPSEFGALKRLADVRLALIPS